MHRQILLTIAALALATAFGACERHSFEKTQVLHRTHGAHGGHGHGNDHGDEEEGGADHHPAETKDAAASPAAEPETPAKGAARDLGVE